MALLVSYASDRSRTVRFGLGTIDPCGYARGMGNGVFGLEDDRLRRCGSCIAAGTALLLSCTSVVPEEAPDPSVTSGLRRDLTIVRTTPEQATQLCSAFSKPRFAEADCMLIAVLQELSVSECESEQQECIEFHRAFPGCPSHIGEGAQESCDPDVTVGEVEDCLRAVLATAGSLTCQDLNDDPRLPDCFSGFRRRCWWVVPNSPYFDRLDPPET